VDAIAERGWRRHHPPRRRHRQRRIGEAPRIECGKAGAEFKVLDFPRATALEIVAEYPSMASVIEREPQETADQDVALRFTRAAVERWSLSWIPRRTPISLPG
jgi:hypothetical protein